MGVPRPAKRVSGQLARLLASADYSSGGSEYGDDAAASDSGLVHDCCEGRNGASVPEEIPNTQDATPEERDCAAIEIVEALMHPTLEANHFLRLLAAAAYQLSLMPSSGSKPAFRRAVMVKLRAFGYNAGICQTRRDDSWGLLAGCYEYIDVVKVAAGDGKRERYIVDLDFVAEFEVARPTEKYKEVLAALPLVAVAEEEALGFVVQAVAEAAIRSLRARGLFVAPWRETSFMLSKWLGPYRRTINPDPAALGWGVNRRAVGLQSTDEPRGGEVLRRVVGFRAATGLPTDLYL